MGVIAVFTVKVVGEYLLKSHTGLFLVIGALGLQIAVMCALSCCEKIRRTFPLNIILLFIYTLVEGIFLGIVSLFLTHDEVSFL